MGNPEALKLVRYHPQVDLEETLREVTLKDDRSVRPYGAAVISFPLTSFRDLSPMALYLMRNRVDDVLELHDAMMTRYALGLWDLPSLLAFRYGSDRIQFISPPVIERYFELGGADAKETSALVDGLHRCAAAQSLGISAARTICLDGVSLPLVPLPVDWHDITIYEQGQRLADEQKRKYRFSSISDVPQQIRELFPIDETNCKYYFHRDLSELGSKGRRNFDEYQ